MARLVALFAGTIWISRSLGPEVFGQFSYFLSVIIYISALDSLCHESIVKQYLSGATEQGLVLGSASVLNGLLAVLSSSIVLGFGLLTIPESLQLAAFLLFIPGQLSKPFHPIANYFDINLLAKYSSFSLFAGALISIIFRSLSASESVDLTYQSFGYSLQFIFFAVGLFLFYRRVASVIKWKVSFKLAKEMAQRSFPIFISAALFLSLSQCDIFMIRHFLGAREVGIYSIVVKLSEPWVIVSSAICTSFFPLIFRQVSGSLKQNKYFVRANQMSIYFVLVLGLILVLFIDKIVALLLGQDFVEAAPLFRIYFWSILFLFFANIQHIWEINVGMYSMAVYKTATAFLLKLGLNLILGTYFGLSGYAYSTLIAMAFYGLGFNAINKTTRPYLRLQVRAFGPYHFHVFFRFARLKGVRWLQREY